MKRLVICDLDNTLYDWVGYFVPAFYAMVDEAVDIMSCDKEKLLDDLRLVHQTHHDSEHPFALLETKTVAERYPGKSRRELAAIFDSAFHAFNSERKKRLQLYDGVEDGLKQLRDSNVTLVAHTEGKLFSVVDRMRRLNITNYFTHIYCRERSSLSHVKSEVGSKWLNSFPMEKVEELSNHQRKPNPKVLKEICEKEGVMPSDCIYIGDSIAKDISMAKALGVKAAWAEYGTKVTPEAYAALVRVSHWTKEDVERESKLKKLAAQTTPDIIIENSFSQLVAYALEM